ncbi:TfoX/Sxy family protein [Amylibacter sp. SFDW26]|uniref:TfoX/Sxy family protein n=1 Tax=Amylibacter sp. SFDW26 TaxID=2652722 RepID=UPI001261F0B3|nr:TfoX/Sxy family protein [Amylibacter sp. SFDW26]KAB7615457.1 TfoX/Sxy family protein [Amylibacter sp. SFDW26]
MDQHSIAVGKLKNIGPTVARRLNEIGIHSKSDLERVGVVTAYCEVKQRYPEASIPVCYYLYSLEGALKNQHWDEIGDDVKLSLKERANRFWNALS